MPFGHYLRPTRSIALRWSRPINNGLESSPTLINVLMSIKFHIFVDHKALPSKAVAPKQKWKTFLGTSTLIVDTFTRLLVAFFLAGPVWAEGSTQITPTEAVQTKIKSILDPVRGLNSEIQVGLQKLKRLVPLFLRARSMNQSKWSLHRWKQNSKY